MSGDADAWNVIGTALRGEGYAADAESAWRRALKIEPRSGIAHHNLGAMLAQQSRSEEALSELDLAAASGIRGSEIDFNRATVLMALNRFEDAEQTLIGRIRSNPQDARAQSLLARIRFMRGAENFAAESAAAVAGYPNDTDLRRSYVTVLRGAGRLQETEATLRDALAAAGPDPGLLAELAAVQQESGRFADALLNARRAMSQKPGEPSFDELAVDALLALGQAEEAMPLIASLRRRNPLNQWYIAMEATAARLLGDRRYDDWYDYANLVQSFELEPPPGWPSIGEFHTQCGKSS